MYRSDRCWPFCSCENETYVGNALKRILMGSHPLLPWQGFKKSFLWDEAIYSPWITKLKLSLTSLPFLIIGRLSILCSLGGFCFLDSWRHHCLTRLWKRYAHVFFLSSNPSKIDLLKIILVSGISSLALREKGKSNECNLPVDGRWPYGWPGMRSNLNST